jgi:hypothetical protein
MRFYGLGWFAQKNPSDLLIYRLKYFRFCSDLAKISNVRHFQKFVKYAQLHFVYRVTAQFLLCIRQRHEMKICLTISLCCSHPRNTGIWQEHGSGQQHRATLCLK